jgi:hypothetical protein
MKASVGSGGVFVFPAGGYVEIMQLDGHWLVVKKGGKAWHVRSDKAWVHEEHGRPKRVRLR